MEKLSNIWDRWHKEMLVPHGLGNKRVWITETGYLDCSKNRSFVLDHMMRKLSDYLRAGAGKTTIQNAAWFVDAHPSPNLNCSVLTDLGTTTTILGDYWNSVGLR